jgi:hypothetical protein
MDTSGSEEYKQPEKKSEYKNDLHLMSNRYLFEKLQEQGKFLIHKEIDLAKAELKASIRSEALLSGGFAVGIATASVTGVLLLVTLIFALSLIMPGWVAGLIVSGALLLVSIIAILFGWIHRVKDPLVRTKEVLKADANLNEAKTKKHAA